MDLNYKENGDLSKGVILNLIELWKYEYSTGGLDLHIINLF